MIDGAEIAKSFYEAFNRRDAAGMNAHYARDVSFSDPGFPGLNGDETRAMWEMLCKNAKDFSVDHKVMGSSFAHADVEWVARYTFSRTGRPVENKVTTRMEIKDGKIVRQSDVFDFYAWAKQAFGFVGYAIGWTPFFQKKVQATARESLMKHMGKSAN
jgi:ketosteroid isomerase-like protein